MTAPEPLLDEQEARARERGFLPRHRAGDEEAFAELLAAYRRPVFAYLARTGVEPQSRDDLFQEVFLKVHRAAHTYDPGRPLKSWVFTIVANTVRDHFRARREATAADAASVLHLADAAPGPERAAVARETAGWLGAALLRLPLAWREVVVLHAVEGLEQGEVGRSLGIPVNTVKTYLRRARLALARELAAREGAAAEEGS